jgi:hypothetical protein
MIARLLAVLLAAAIPQQQNNLIDWDPSRKLTWADFKGPVDTASKNAALTSSSINIEFGYDDSGLEYSIKCSFNKEKSWVRVRNDEVLAHEQGHFDLAELHARKLNKAMKAYKFNPKTVSTDVNRIYDSLMNVHHQAQNRYDLETDFSRNKVKQEEWLKKIAGELKSLQAFASYRKSSTQ